MSTQEHLNKIKAFCERNLALAALRTPGKWRYNEGHRMAISALAMHQDPVLWGDDFELSDLDAAFIAACAGAAEAGWKATLAAIDGLQYMTPGISQAETLNAILAAYPVEMLSE